MQKAVHRLDCTYPVTAVAFSEPGDQVITGDTSGTVQLWDLRKGEVLFKLEGHTDIITGLEVSPDGNFVLSNSMDNTLRSWDIRPFVKQGDAGRLNKIFTGHAHNVDKNLLRCSWKPDGQMVAAGSSDAPPHVHVWDTKEGKVQYKLPGHKAAINQVVFHPKEPIVGSCSSDKAIYLGELVGGDEASG